MGETDLFVVRIWHQLATGFRASVRRVDNEQTRLFSRPDDLARFLSTPPQASTEGDAAPRPTPPDHRMP
jgi:hypothetical protein